MSFSCSSISKPRNPKEPSLKENTAKWLIFKDSVPMKQKKLSLPNSNVVPRRLKRVSKEIFDDQTMQGMTFEERKKEYRKELATIEKELKERKEKRETTSRLDALRNSHMFMRSLSEPRYDLMQPSMPYNGYMETIEEVDEQLEESYRKNKSSENEKDDQKPNFGIKELILSTPEIQ